MLGVVVRRKTEAQLKKEAKERAAKALRRTKERYGLGEPAGLRGVVSCILRDSHKDAGSRTKRSSTSCCTRIIKQTMR